ncbi:hypothetical protein [Pantoea ananatis]|uniref:hypothetical protein n=1 Tax=Pantoea ananas TaxID=553 RepID=UPI001FF0B782|nr:hypothetical protein [Pantoea ananatis]
MSEISKLIAEIKSKGILRAGNKMEQLYSMATELESDHAALQQKLDALAVESDTNLRSAASELNTSWMLHKTMMGAQAALLCLSQGDILSAKEWLEGTTDEAIIEMPEDLNPRDLQAWFDSNMVSNGGFNGFLTHNEALELLRKRAPATDAYLNSVRAEGIHFAVNRMLAAWECGFINDTPEQAHDISGAVLSALEFLPNASPEEFKRDYADKVRDSIAARLRSGTHDTADKAG